MKLCIQMRRRFFLIDIDMMKGITNTLLWEDMYVWRENGTERKGSCL